MLFSEMCFDQARGRKCPILDARLNTHTIDYHGDDITIEDGNVTCQWNVVYSGTIGILAVWIIPGARILPIAIAFNDPSCSPGCRLLDRTGQLRGTDGVSHLAILLLHGTVGASNAASVGCILGTSVGLLLGLSRNECLGAESVKVKWLPSRTHIV